MGDKKKKQECYDKLCEIQKIFNKNGKILLSDYDIKIIQHLLYFMIDNQEDSRKIVNGYLNCKQQSKYYGNNDDDDMPSDDYKNSVKKSEKDAFYAPEREIQANNNSIRKTKQKSEAEYKIFCIKKSDDFKYPGNDSNDAEKYYDKFISGLASLIRYLKPLKKEKSFEIVSRKLVECQYDFNDYLYDVLLKGKRKNISETAVKTCFKYMNETFFESVIPILYSHIYNYYEKNKDMYIRFLAELNKFIKSMGIFTCNEFTENGKSLIGEKLISLDEKQRMFYITIPLASGEPEKNGIITAVEQLPYVTYYMEENGSLKRIFSKGKLIVIKSI